MKHLESTNQEYITACETWAEPSLVFSRVKFELLPIMEVCPKCVQQYKAPNEISVVWWTEDIQGMEGYEDFTDDEARQVLQLARDNHDATIGINWDVLEMWADEVKSKR